MLSILNRRYFFFGIIVLLFFIPSVKGEYNVIYIINVITFLTFYITINRMRFHSDAFYTKQRLTYLVFLYTLFFIIIYKSLSYYYRDNFFVFSEADAVSYHSYAIKMAAMSLGEGINYVLSGGHFEYDDIGMFIVVSTLYRVIESNLILGLFHVFVGVITALGIFRISKNFISKKYSFLCALTYSISSFVIWFQSSGLKESFMVMLIIVFFDYYYMFFKSRRKIIYLFISLLPLFTILLFRPVLSLFCIFSAGFAILLSVKRKTAIVLIIIFSLVGSVSLLSLIGAVAQRYIGERSMEQVVEDGESTGMVKGGSVSFTYVVNIMASAIGPLPTILPNEKQMLSFFSIGLIYRVFLSFAFWFGVYYSIKEKNVFLNSLLLFTFLEIISLIILMESLELRKSLPHFPFVYIVSFWFLDYYDRKAIDSKLFRERLKYLFNFVALLFFFAIVYWNLR